MTVGFSCQRKYDFSCNKAQIFVWKTPELFRKQTDWEKKQFCLQNKLTDISIHMV